MNIALVERLNEINPKLASKEFLTNGGLGNELPFYIFDYPPEEELEVRRFLPLCLEYLRRKKVKVAHINLFEFTIEYLKKRKLLDAALSTQRKSGNAALLKALRAPLNEEKLARTFIEVAQPLEHDLVLLSGIGSAWPLVRSHTLLNALHPLMHRTPLVIFYPGKYDRQYLVLFGILDRRYYRAFPLIP